MYTMTVKLLQPHRNAVSCTIANGQLTKTEMRTRNIKMIVAVEQPPSNEDDFRFSAATAYILPSTTFS